LNTPKRKRGFVKETRKRLPSDSFQTAVGALNITKQ
jgi:hypothetical protein